MSPLKQGMVVLAMLHEGPMHPYEMQRLLRERHKDELLVLKRGSLYHAINRLLRAHLIDAVDIGRNLPRFPIIGKDHYNLMVLMYGKIGMLEVRNDTLQNRTVTAEAFERMSKALAGVRSVKTDFGT